MSTQILVMPTGPRATPEAIERWRQTAQRIADEWDAEFELIDRCDDGTIESHIVATPESREPV